MNIIQEAERLKQQKQEILNNQTGPVKRIQSNNLRDFPALDEADQNEALRTPSKTSSLNNSTRKQKIKNMQEQIKNLEKEQ